MACKIPWHHDMRLEASNYSAVSWNLIVCTLHSATIVCLRLFFIVAGVGPDASTRNGCRSLTSSNVIHRTAYLAGSPEPTRQEIFVCPNSIPWPDSQRPKTTKVAMADNESPERRRPRRMSAMYRRGSHLSEYV